MHRVNVFLTTVFHSDTVASEFSKLELPKLSGKDITKWPSFWKQFISFIIEKQPLEQVSCHIFYQYYKDIRESASDLGFTRWNRRTCEKLEALDHVRNVTFSWCQSLCHDSPLTCNWNGHEKARTRRATSTATFHQEGNRTSRSRHLRTWSGIWILWTHVKNDKGTLGQPGKKSCL